MSRISAAHQGESFDAWRARREREQGEAQTLAAARKEYERLRAAADAAKANADAGRAKVATHKTRYRLTGDQTI